jgi:hypothetical protein
VVAPVVIAVVAPAKAPIEPPPVPVPEGKQAEEPVPSLPGLSFISRRSEEPKEGTPIAYREYAFAVEPGLTPKDLDRYVRATWEQVRTALASRSPGKFVQIALFDHHFTGRPERPPVAVLAWKDWRGDPVIQIRDAAAPPPAAIAALTAIAAMAAVAERPAVAPEPIVAATAAPIAPPAVSFPASKPVAHGFPEPPVSASPRAPGQGPILRTTSRPLAPVETASGRRSPSEDLISELFEEMHQLCFMPDIVTGAEYVLNVLGRVLPCEGVLVHVFDINTRQFIVVRAVGPTSQNALLHRTPDTFALFRETFRRARTLSFPNADAEEGFHDGRWERLGVAPRIALCGAVQQGGRYLGVIELANPRGGEAFHDSEINAVDYICEQFADFVASRPIVLDDDAVIPQA